MRIKHLLAIFTALAISLSANVFAQSDAIVAGMSDADLQAAVATAVANGEDPAAIATALAASGQSVAQIAQSLAQANVAPAAVATAVVAAVPAASSADISTGMQQAGVPALAAAAASTNAVVANVVAQVQAAAPGTVNIAGQGGALVTADGTVVATVTQEELNQARQQIVESVVAVNPQLFPPETIASVSGNSTS